MRNFLTALALTLTFPIATVAQHFSAPSFGNPLSYGDPFFLESELKDEYLNGDIAFNELMDQLRYQGHITAHPSGLFFHPSFRPDEDTVCYQHCYHDENGDNVCIIVCGNG